jgi:exodeoxyribonuclease VII large subunit
MPDIPSIRLSELTSKITETLKNVFSQQSFWVIADISNYSFQQQKGYHHFDLVEKDPFTNNMVARVQATAWGVGSTRIKEFEAATGQRFQNDINVLVQVSVEYHAIYGLKLTMLNVDPAFSIGQMEQAKQATLKRLLTECADFITKQQGNIYITRNKQLPLPAVIQQIALITSDSSAAIQDFLHTLESNKFHYRFEIDKYFTLVQGQANAQAFYNKLIDVFQSGKKYDVVVIIRGGGAQTDFLIFDQFILGKVVAKFPIPIITGIGHQKDETIVDMMAHSPTKTPTKAAEYIISHNRSFEDNLVAEQKAIIIRAQQSLSTGFQSLNQLNTLVLNRSRNKLTTHKDFLVQFAQITINNSKTILYKHRSTIILFSNQVASRPKALVSNRSNDLKNAVGNFQSFSKIFLSKQSGYIQHLDAMARLMSPVNILKKGFAILYHENKIVSDPDKIPIGSDVDIRLTDTYLQSTIKSKNKTDGNLFNI